MRPFESGQQGRWDGWFGGLTTLVAVAALSKQFLPQEWVRAVRRFCFSLTNFINPYVVYMIPEFSADSSSVEQLYEKSRQYLSNKGIAAAHRMVINQPKNTSSPIFTMGDNEAVSDAYQGAHFQWTHYTAQRTNQVLSYDSNQTDERHSFQLRVRHKHRGLVQQYLQHVCLSADAEEKKRRQLLVYTNTGAESFGHRRGKRMWESQPFTHPATFDTIALDSKVRHTILSKLDSFAADAEHYRRTGRPHKFGAFLFGPPGTGKTSIIAAIANHMRYSIYDLDLTGVNSNLDLRALLTQISDRAVVVIEDIDTVDLPQRVPREVCIIALKSKEGLAAGQQPAGPGRKGGGFSRFGGVEEQAPKSKLTLGGLLNFADGIRSSCGSERIFVFTTNHPERLDPALVRPGRMDLHLELGFCSGDMAAELCVRYLGVKDAALLDEVRGAVGLAEGSRITPAEVAGVLDAGRGNPEGAVRALLRRCGVER